MYKGVGRPTTSCVRRVEGTSKKVIDVSGDDDDDDDEIRSLTTTTTTRRRRRRPVAAVKSPSRPSSRCAPPLPPPPLSPRPLSGLYVRSFLFRTSRSVSRQSLAERTRFLFFTNTHTRITRTCVHAYASMVLLIVIIARTPTTKYVSFSCVICLFVCFFLTNTVRTTYAFFVNAGGPRPRCRARTPMYSRKNSTIVPCVSSLSPVSHHSSSE